MVLMQFQIHSKILQMETDVWALIPGTKPAPRRPNGQNQDRTAPEDNQEETWKVLWLLHGGVGDHTFWLRHTPIESIAESYGNLAVILPDAYGSSCVDTVSGARFGTYLSQELPGILRRILPKLSDKREDNWVSGFSNGGYGSLYLGFTFPESYGAVGAFGAGDKADADFTNIEAEKERLFGKGDLHSSPYCVSQLAKDLGKSDRPKPILCHGCGSEDPWRDMNEIVRDAILSVPGDPYHYEFRIWEGLGHSSACCEAAIRYFIQKMMEQ